MRYANYSVCDIIAGGSKALHREQREKRYTLLPLRQLNTDCRYYTGCRYC